jgi:hypothetical protein
VGRANVFPSFPAGSGTSPAVRNPPQPGRTRQAAAHPRIQMRIKAALKEEEGRLRLRPSLKRALCLRPAHIALSKSQSALAGDLAPAPNGVSEARKSTRDGGVINPLRSPMLRTQGVAGLDAAEPLYRQGEQELVGRVRAADSAHEKRALERKLLRRHATTN